MPNGKSGFEGYEGIAGNGGSLADILASFEAGPRTQPTQAPLPPKQQAITAISPVTDDEIRAFALDAATLASKYSFAPDENTVADWIRRASQDRTGDAALMIKKVMGMKSQGDQDYQNQINQNYVTDINNPSGNLGRNIPGLPEVSRMSKGFAAGVLGDVVGAGEELARHPLDAGLALSGKLLSSATSGPVQMASDATARLIKATTGRDVNLRGSSVGDVGERLANGVVAKRRDARVEALSRGGADPAAILARQSFDSFGPSNPIANVMGAANRASNEITKENSFGDIYQTDSPELGDRIKSGLMTAAADTPFNVAKMAPLMLAGAAVGGPVAGAGRGMKAIQWTNPITGVITDIDTSAMAARVVSTFPEAMGEAQRAATDYREKAIRAGIDPTEGAARAWTNTFAGNVGLLFATNHFGDGKVMVQTFLRDKADLAAAGAVKAMAVNAERRFGKTIAEKAKAVAEKMGLKDIAGDFIGEGMEEYLQKIISDSTSNPNIVTWNDIKNSALSADALAEFAGGAFAGAIVGAGSRRGSKFVYGKEEHEEGVVKVRAQEGAAPVAPIAPTQVKERGLEELVSGLAAAREAVPVPESLPRNAMGKALYEEAGLGKEEAVLAKELSRMIADANRGGISDPFGYARMQTPQVFETTEGAQTMAQLKAVYDKLLAAQRSRAMGAATADFMATLPEHDAIKLDKYISDGGAIQAMVAPQGKAAVGEEGPTTAPSTDVSQIADQSKALSTEAMALLAPAHAELQTRKAAIDQHLENSSAVEDALSQREPAEGEAKFNKGVFKRATEKFQAATKTLSPEAAMALLSEEEQAQIKLGEKREADRTQVREDLRTKLHDIELNSVAEKHGQGHEGFSEALRSYDPASFGASIPIEMMPSILSGPTHSLRSIGPNGVLAVASSLGVEGKVKAAMKVLGKTLASLPEHVQLAARRHGATSIRMASALKLLNTGITTPGVKEALNAMNLSKSEQTRINAAFSDAQSMQGMATRSTPAVAEDLLTRYNQDVVAKLTPQSASVNALNNASGHPVVSSLLSYGMNLGMTAKTVLEVIKAASGVAQRDRIRVKKGDLKSEINASLRRSEAVNEDQRITEFTNTKEFSDTVKGLLDDHADLITGTKYQAPAGYFDLSTAAGKVQSLGYAYAMRYIMEQRSTAMAWISQVGKKVTPDNYGWSRARVMAFVNAQMESVKADSQPPTNDKGKKTGKARTWQVRDDDYRAITKALTDQGILAPGAKGALEITGIVSPTNMGRNINPSDVAQAFQVPVYASDVATVRVPSMEDLTAGLNPDQILMLDMYHGLNAFAGNYMSFSQIGKAMNMSEEEATKQVRHAQGVIASRFPNTRLMAQQMANQVVHIVDTLEHRGPSDIDTGAAASDLEAMLRTISTLPGALTSFTHAGNVINAETRENEVINKGFFPTIHDIIIDLFADKDLIAKRDDLKKGFLAARDEYESFVKKGKLTDAEAATASTLRDTFIAKRDKYFSAMGMVYHTVAPETRAYLNFIDGAIQRKGVGVARSANLREDLAVRAADASMQNRRDDAAKVGSALAETVSEILEGFGIPRQETGYLRNQIQGAAQTAYLGNMGVPIRAAIMAASETILNSYYGHLVGKELDGSSTLNKAFVEEIRNVDRAGRDTSARAELDAANAKVDAAEAALEATQKTARQARARKAALSKNQVRVQALRARNAEIQARVVDLTGDIMGHLFRNNLSSAVPVRNGFTISEALNSAIIYVESIPSEVGREVKGLSALTTDMRKMLAGSPESRAKIAPTVARRIESVAEGLRAITPALTGVVSAGSPFLRSEASSMLRKVQASYGFVHRLGKALADARAMAVREQSGVLAGQQGAISDIRSIADEIKALQAEADTNEAKIPELRKVLVSAQKSVNEAERSVRNAQFHLNEAERATDRLSKSVLPNGEAEIARAFGIEDGAVVEEEAPEHAGLVSDEEAMDAGLSKAQIFKSEMSASGYTMADRELSRIAEKMFAMVGGRGGAGRALRESRDHITNLREELNALDPDGDGYYTESRNLKARIEEAQEQHVAFEEQLKRGGGSANMMQVALSKAIEEILQTSERLGLDRDVQDRWDIRATFAMTGLGYIADNPNFSKLLTMGKDIAIDEHINPLIGLFRTVDPTLDASVAHMMAVGALEVLTGKKQPRATINLQSVVEALGAGGAVTAVVEEQERATTPQVENKSPEELFDMATSILAKGITPESGAKAGQLLERASRNAGPNNPIQDKITKMRGYIHDQHKGGGVIVSENKGTAMSSALRKGGVVAGVDLLGIYGLSQTSPEGAALMLTAGIGYVAYKLGMSNPTFSGVMNKLKVNTRNTVSEIALKIRSAAKGISTYVSRLMAAFYKDGTTVDGGNKTTTLEEDRNTTLKDEPVSDEKGYLTEEGDFQMLVNARVMSDPVVFVEKYTAEPATFGGRVFSFDVLLGRLIHAGEGGVFSWLRTMPSDINVNFWAMVDHALAKTAADGGKAALVVGPNGAGKTTFMGGQPALARYQTMVEASGYKLKQLAFPLRKAASLGAPMDIVYISRGLDAMIEGVVRRGIEEERLTSAAGFADTLMTGIRSTVLMANNHKNGSTIFVDSLTGETLEGEDAINRMKDLYRSYNSNDIQRNYRDTITRILEEKDRANETIKPAVRGWLDADRNGNLTEFLRDRAKEGYRSPTAAEAGVQNAEGSDLVAHLFDPDSLESGSPIPSGAIEINADEIESLNHQEEKAVVDAGKSKDGGLQYLNSGVNLDAMASDLSGMVEKSVAWAKDRKAERKHRSKLDATGKEFIQFVHRFASDETTRLMDKVNQYFHARYAIVGAAQPVLQDLQAYQNTHRGGAVSTQDSYSMLGRAMMDSSVQERVITDKELATKYGLDPEGIASYKRVGDFLKGTQSILVASFNEAMEKAVSSLRVEQDSLDPSSEHYAREYDAIEDRIDQTEDNAAKMASIIKRNPYFVSLSRNERGTRQLDMVGKDGERLGMILVDTGSVNRGLNEAQKKEAIEQMIRQHASRLWSEAGRTGTEARFEQQVRAAVAAGDIKFGAKQSEASPFVEGETRQVRQDSHTNFIKMAGGIMSVDTLRHLLEQRGEGVSKDMADAMLRDLTYMIGASEAQGRLTHARSNAAGYSEDPIGSLASYAQSVGYMVAALRHSGEIRTELDAFKKYTETDPDKMGINTYEQGFNYVMGAIAPGMRANTWTKVNDAMRFYSAWKTLYGKLSFPMQNGFQGAVVSRMRMMSLYDTGYTNQLYRQSAHAALELIYEMRGLGKDLSQVEPSRLDAALDKAFTQDRFNQVWATKEEADRMAPVVKDVIRELVKGQSFREINVGMMLGVEDVASNELSRRTSDSLTKQGWEKFRDVSTYLANKGENFNRLRDTISYIVACATESRAKDAGKQSGKWAQYGYVSITDNSYNRLTFSDLFEKTKLEVEGQYRGMAIPKSRLEAMAYKDTISKIMTYAERQSAHSNFNTGRGFGTSLIWDKNNQGGVAQFFRTAMIMRAFGLNVLASWSSNMATAAKRFKAEGRPPTEAWIRAAKAPAYGAIATMILGGTFGPPFAGVLAGVMSYIWNLLDKLRGKAADHDVKRDYVQWVKENMGQKASDFMAAGIFGLTPLYGFGAQLSMGEGPFRIGKNWKETATSAALGVNASAIDSASRGWDRFRQGATTGDKVAGLGHIVAPAGIDKLIDAYGGELAPGRKKPAGSEGFYKMTPTEIAVKTLGITPRRESAIYDQDSENYFLKDRRKEIIDDLQRAYDNKAITKDSWDEMRAWNEAMIERKRPDMIVKSRPQSLRNRMKREIVNQGRITDRITDEEAASNE